ncbi:DUF72 domain-containing protein [Pleomorphomonas oryzae]|uniref:DUF72 domain-containing protein n=1 Tax=Pleomorphomonas oryzae TaxID=261934 RepID=UPI00040CBBE2|nr:DUF72 domain-containing protein [Pleomorphomonas oryzae]
MRSNVGIIRIGLSGWTYSPWRGHFYPKGLRQSQELAYAASRFSSLEINGTFYGLQKPRTFDRWAADTPTDFLFAVKGPRFITHVKRLKDVEAPLANFFASGPLRLGTKLGPILWQFPPSFHFDFERIRDFLALLPKDTDAATDMAMRHDDHVRDPDAIRPAKQPMRYALEIRHNSFRNPAFIDLLREHNVALVCADTVEWPLLMDVTSDFVYCRLHGSRDLYRSGYDEAERQRWARRVAAWSHGEPMDDGDFVGDRRAPNQPRDVFLFFDNTDGLRAPDDALAIMRELGVEWHGDTTHLDPEGNRLLLL